MNGKENAVHIHKGILFSHKRIKILSFAATWMKLEAIKVREIRQTLKSTTCSHSYVEAKNADLMKVECRMMVPRDWGGFMYMGGDKERLVNGGKH